MVEEKYSKRCAARPSEVIGSKQVARMSEAKWGFPELFNPACRFAHAGDGAYTQFSVLTPGIRANSRMLLVTTISPSLRA